ncbi:MAG: hypothetical protein CR977_00120 [Gammaproteobacteria bacterium]|nr:MAG: hypothetical protein CR977_00120 [Gammaproteobacteria bacterium]
MRLNRCPICHSPVDIFALAKDDATSKLLGKLAGLDTLTGNALLDYLGLFTPAKTALATDRALRLIEEIECLAGGDWLRVAAAMVATVDNMRQQTQSGKPVKQFKSHAYLQKVFEQTQPGEALMPTVPASAGKKSKTRGAIETLEALKDD